MKSKKISATILLFAVFMWLIAGLIFYFNKKSIEKTEHYISVVGFVVDYDRRYDPVDDEEQYNSYFDPDYIYAIIVEYYVDGERYEVESEKYSRDPKFIGSPVEISYDPDDPYVAIIDKTNEEISGYIASGLFAIGGIVVVIIYIRSLIKRG